MRNSKEGELDAKKEKVVDPGELHAIELEENATKQVVGGKMVIVCEPCNPGENTFCC